MPSQRGGKGNAGQARPGDRAAVASMKVKSTPAASIQQRSTVVEQGPRPSSATAKPISPPPIASPTAPPHSFPKTRYSAATSQQHGHKEDFVHEDDAASRHQSCQDNCSAPVTSIEDFLDQNSLEQRQQQQTQQQQTQQQQTQQQQTQQQASCDVRTRKYSTVVEQGLGVVGEPHHHRNNTSRPPERPVSATAKPISPPPIASPTAPPHSFPKTRHSTATSPHHGHKENFVHGVVDAASRQQSWQNDCSAPVISIQDFLDQSFLEQQQQQQQQQIQLQASRDVRTSRQMVYDVLKWTIASIEILEYLEHLIKTGDRLQMSEISNTMYLTMKANHGRDQITEEEMTQRCDAYLLIMQTQLRSCDRSIKDRIGSELRPVVAEWTATGCQNTGYRSQHYKNQLMSVVDGHKPELLRIRTEETTDPDARTMGYVFQKLQAGLKMGDKLEEEFRRDPKKRPHLPEFRTDLR